MAQTSRSDAELVAEARDARDLAAFAELVGRYQHALFGVAFTVVHDRALAEDATQEAFLRAWVSLDRLREPSRVAPWLCGIARNVSRALHRDRTREVPDDAEPALASEATPLRALMDREADHALSELLARVPNRYRTPMVLHYAAEQSVTQIAACLGLTEANVKKLLSRGREMLRERADRFGELAGACRAPATLAVTIVAAAAARTAAASTATAGAITTLATTGIVVKKIALVTAAAVACLLTFLGVQRLRVDAPARARATTPSPAAASRVEPAAAAATPERRRITGVVVEERTSTPIAGATVLVESVLVDDLVTDLRDRAQMPTAVIADEHGRFAVEVTAGRLSIDATARGFVSAKPIELDARAAGADAITLRLARGGIRLHGTVADFQGGAIVEAVVTATSAPGGVPTERARAAITDPDGRYELWLPPGDYDLQAAHLAYAPATAEVTIASVELERDLLIVPASSIEGVVLDVRDRSPVPGAVVFVEGEPDLGALADEHGRFHLARIAAGTFAIGARARHQVTPTSTVVELDIGETRDGLELWVDRGVDVAGRVVDDAGRPLAGVSTALVRWADQLALPAHATTDADGRFTIHGVPRGTYGGLADAPGRPRAVRMNAIVVGDQDVADLELVLRSGHDIVGRVSPPRAATVRLAREAGPALAAMALGGDVSDLLNLMTLTTRTRPNGTFALDRVAPGAYVVIAVADDGSRGTAEVAVGPGTNDVMIALAATPAATGVVVDERTHKPVADLTLHATSADHFPEQEQPVITDAAGRFVLRGFPPGTPISLDVGDAAGCRRRLVSGGRLMLDGAAPAPEVKVTVSGCDHVVHGSIVDKDGAPVVDAWVQLEDASADDEVRRLPTLTDARGRFRMQGLHAGPFVLSAYHPAHGRARLAAAATDTEHRIVLRKDAELAVTVTPAAAFELFLDGAVRRTVRSRDARGTTTVSDLPAGSYVLEATTDAGSQRTTITVEPGAKQAITIAVQRWSVVRGTLLGVDGSPLANHAVTPLIADRDNTLQPDQVLSKHNTTTDREGRFELRRVPAGANVLIVTSPTAAIGGAPLKPPLAAGEIRDLGRATVRLAPVP